MGRSLAAVLALSNIMVGPANNDRGKGLGWVDFVLANPAPPNPPFLTISPICKDSIAEFALYRVKNRRDPNDHTTYATSSPVEHHGDAMDARRYAIVAIFEGMVLNGATVPEMVLER